MLPAEIDESPRTEEAPSAYVDRLAKAKAEHVAGRVVEEDGRPAAAGGVLVVGGDTVVARSAELLGKPVGEGEALSMLLSLAGAWHEVHTAAAVTELTADGIGRTVSKTVVSRVRFRRFDQEHARRYVATGEPMDKAGAYGVQRLGASLVERIEGDFHAVMGLPAAALVELIASLGWSYDFQGLRPSVPAAAAVVDAAVGGTAARGGRTGKPSAVLAIDAGTTGIACMVVDAEGRVRSRAYSEFGQSFPKPGWVEHDPDEIWATTCRVARNALAGARQVEVCAIGIANQRETVAIWDRETLAPLAPAIVWQDRRTAPLCEELRDAGHEARIRARTGLLLDPYFSGTKLSWLLDTGDLRFRAEAGGLAAGTMDSWLVARLTNGAAHVTEPTNASRTMLLRLADSRWDPWLADLLGVPLALLPEVRPSAGRLGRMGVASAEHLGIEAPIGGVAGDQQAALFGQGCTRPGMAKNTYGTGAFLLLYVGDQALDPPPGLLATLACGPRGERAFAFEGSVLVAGAAIQWLRDGLGILGSAEESETLAGSLPSNEGVHFVPAFAGLGAPKWEPRARGTLVGLSRGTRREHLARAALEAMAHGSMDVLDAMTSGSGRALGGLAADGGAAANDWLMQFQAELAGVPLRRAANVESTALGAAGLAGISAGLWRDASEFVGAATRFAGEGQLFEPTISSVERERLRAGWKRAVRAALTWAEG